MMECYQRLGVPSRFLLDVVSLTTLAVRSTASRSPSAALSWFCNQCAMFGEYTSDGSKKKLCETLRL